MRRNASDHYAQFDCRLCFNNKPSYKHSIHSNNNNNKPYNNKKKQAILKSGICKFRMCVCVCCCTGKTYRKKIGYNCKTICKMFNGRHNWGVCVFKCKMFSNTHKLKCTKK